MSSNTNWSIERYQLKVNGKTFFAKGVTYSPTPWGHCPSFVPYGDYTINTWKSVWQRDLALMRENGVNMLKTYNTLDAAQLISGGNPPDWDHDHTEFLNACWNDGVNPVYVMMGYAPPKNMQQAYLPNSWDDPQNVSLRTKIKSDLLDVAKTYGSFPAVMGFVMANELNADNIIQNPRFFEYWNEVAQAIGTVANGKLTALANVDDTMNTVSLGNKAMTAANFIWGYNTYRGNWKNSNGFDNLFSTFETATSANPHPLMLTEWGAPASTHDSQGKMTNMSAQQMQNLVTYLTGHYEDILNHRSDIGSGVCCGGAYFEWTDEYWKADPAGKQCGNKDGWAPECHTGIWDPGPDMKGQDNFPGNFWDEEGFGLFAIAPVSPTNRKPASPGACIGPWDADNNQPYPPDTLTMRDHANALFARYKS